MNSLIVALLLAASAQSTGTLSPTSDLSQNRVKATGASQSRSLADRAADVVNVKDFGAKGDGTTDDSAAFQAAVDAAIAGGGGAVVTVPWTAAGYRVSAVTVSGPVRVIGSTKRGVKIQPALTTTTMFVLSGQFARLEGLYLDSSLFPYSTYGVDIQAAQVGIVDCWFTKFDHAVRVRAGFSADEWEIIRSRFSDNTYGLRSYGSSINARIESSSFNANKSAIYLRDDVSSPTEGVRITNCLVYTSGDSGLATAAIDISGIDYVFISGSVIDLNYYTALQAGDSLYLSVSDSYFSSIFDTGARSTVKLDGNCSYAKFTNTTIRGSAQTGGYALFITQSGGTSFTTLANFTNVLLQGNTSASPGSAGDLDVDGASSVTFTDSQFLSTVAAGVAVLRTGGADTASVSFIDSFLTNASSTVYVGTNALVEYRGLSARADAITVFTGSCVASAVAGQSPRVYLDGGTVHLVGRVKSSSGAIAPGATLFTLPAPYRPDRTVRVITSDNLATTGNIQIGSDGTVSVANGITLTAGSNELPLDAIRFRRLNQ